MFKNINLLWLLLLVFGCQQQSNLQLSKAEIFTLPISHTSEDKCDLIVNIPSKLKMLKSDSQENPEHQFGLPNNVSRDKNLPHMIAIQSILDKSISSGEIIKDFKAKAYENNGKILQERSVNHGDYKENYATIAYPEGKNIIIMKQNSYSSDTDTANVIAGVILENNDNYEEAIKELSTYIKKNTRITCSKI